ncbi:MAG: helix-turn-helix domain-containing protein [Clostridiales bacterium]
MDNTKLVYSVQETSKILNIGMNRIYKLLRDNTIPNVRLGKKIIIPKKALENWLMESAGVDK